MPRLRRPHWVPACAGTTWISASLEPISLLAELDKLKDPLKGLNPQYFVLAEEGFRA